MCVSAGILLIYVKAVMNTRTKKHRILNNSGAFLYFSRF